MVSVRGLSSGVFRLFILGLAFFLGMPHAAHAQAGKMHYYSHVAPPSKGPHPDTQLPIAGAHIYLFSVGMTGANTGGQSLLTGSGVTHDSAGNGYVVTDSQGMFNLSGLYSCPTASSLLYILSVDGSAGGTGNNPYLAEMVAVPGTCSQAPDLPGLSINEATTAAAAFALAAFADASDDGFSGDSSSGPALTDAFAYANYLASGITGYVGYDANNPGVQSDIDTVADVIGACINSGGSTCTSLMSYTTVSGQPAPADTFKASVSMALNPTNQVANLYSLIGANPPFAPIPTSAPSTLQISITGAPVINSLSEQTANVGDTLTISGANFLPTGSATTSVVVGGVTVTPTSSTATSLTVTVPQGASNSGVQVYVGNYGSNPAILKLRLAPTINVTLSPTTSDYGNPVQIAVTVSSSTSIIPTGTVTCTAPGISAQVITLVSGTGNAAGSVSVSGISIGAQQPVACQYSGDSGVAPGAAPTQYETVLPNTAAVTVTITTSETPSVYGDIVTLAANVAPQATSSYTPTGTVTFYDSGTELGAVQLPTTGYATALLATGSHSITATYSGDANFSSGTSAVLSQVVGTQQTSCPSAQ